MSNKLYDELIETSNSDDLEKYHFKSDSSFGLCHQCTHIQIIKTKYDHVFAKCACDWEQKNEIKPNRVDPIVECSNFYPKGQLRLREMSNIATLIDIKRKKKNSNIGFLNNNEDDIEVIITNPSNKY